MSPVKSNKDRVVNRTPTFAEVILPSGCFSGFVTGIIFLINLFAYFFLFPVLFPHVAYDYIVDPNLRLKGTVDFASLFFVSIWLFRFNLIYFLEDKKSIQVLVRMNFVISMIFSVAIISSMTPLQYKIILSAVFFLISVLNFVSIFSKKHIYLWSGIFSFIIFSLLRIGNIVQL